MKFSELTEQQTEKLYSVLLEKAKSFETDDNNSQGVSDSHELVNQVYVRMVEKDLEVPEDSEKWRNMAMRLLRRALEELTGGTAPTRKGEGGRLKYGKFEQQECFDVAQPEPYVHVSDLDEAMSYVRIMMRPTHYETIFGAEKGLVALGSVEAFAEANGVEYDAARQAVLRARIDFLSSVPVDSQLHTYTRRLRTKYGVTA